MYWIQHHLAGIANQKLMGLAQSDAHHGNQRDPSELHQRGIHKNKKTRHVAGFLGDQTDCKRYFSLISLYSTCLRALGSYFMIAIFSGMVFLFLVVV
jgi:hypothetical protein